MEKIPVLKLEKKTIAAEELRERAPKLFQPIGKETIRNSGRVEIENEKLKISIRYADINFNIDNIPRTEEEMIGTHLNGHERLLLKFLDFKPENFYELRYFLLEGKDNFRSIELEEYDTRQIRIFVLKNGKNIEGSSAHSTQDYIKLNAEPKTAGALLMAFHEIGHKKDPNISFWDAYASRMSEKDREIDNKKMLDRERYAWAYSLSQLKPFLEDMNVDSKELDILIHERCLGSYSDFIKNNS